MKTISLFSQSVSINNDGSLPNASAMLDIKSGNKGILIPRTSTSTRTTITGVKGLLLYDSTTASFWYHTGAAWTELGSAASPGWLLNGNGGTNASTNFMGTIDNQPLSFRQNNKWLGKWNALNSNYFIGAGAGENNVTGINNTALGDSAGFSAGAVSHNVLIGKNAGRNNTGSWTTIIGNEAGLRNQANGNVFIGSASGMKNITGFQNTFVGDNAGREDSLGYDNSFFGSYAGQYSSGFENSFFGALSGTNNRLGNYNSFFGSISGLQNNTGAYNSFFGYQAGRLNTSGSYNIFMGNSSGYRNQTGILNVAIGNASLYFNTTKNNLVAIGDSALYNNIGSANLLEGTKNTAVGSKALYTNSTGYNNTALGFNSLKANGTGTWNTALGTDALLSNTVANFNTAVGNESLYSNTQGPLNAAFGTSALYNNASGFGNTAVGHRALYSNTGQNINTAIGINADAAEYVTNSTAVGAYAYVATSNSMVLGGISGINGATANTNVGIGTTTPHAPLQFGNTLASRKIVMWETANNDYDYFGFGINGSTLRYNIPNDGSIHRFFAGPVTLLTLYNNGNATLAGTLTQLSDARLKQDITPVKSTINDIKKINAYSYYWKDQQKDKDPQIGLLAQEVDEVFPQLVKKDSEGLMSVNYSGFVPLLIKSMQEQQEMIEQIQKRMELLEEQYKKLLQLLDLKNIKYNISAIF